LEVIVVYCKILFSVFRNYLSGIDNLPILEIMGEITTMTGRTTMTKGKETGITTQDHDLVLVVKVRTKGRSHPLGWIGVQQIIAVLTGHGTQSKILFHDTIPAIHLGSRTPRTVVLPMRHMACIHQYQL
jgi:hypothetical protein